jgi:metal-dependent amidase/aminoacylase/carboxypeptidase family protein
MISEGLEKTMVEIRRHIHAHPEPGFEETATKTYLLEKLTHIGVSSS